MPEFTEYYPTLIEGMLDGPALDERYPRITAHDESLGRMALNGLEMGNTGWRLCTNTNLGSPANITCTTYWRRVGNVVSILLFSYSTGGSWSDADTAANNLTIPVGFAPIKGGVVGTGRNSVTGGHVLIYAPEADPPIYIRARTDMAASQGLQATQVTYQTDAAWPTSLPGSQHTAPFPS